MKIRYSILLILCVISGINAQQDPQYTQYMYNTMTVNPAYAGSSGHSIIN
ncbi:type IX secretion system membrane protein PorP/SprF, partial [Tenacibaculum finnmarkense]